MSGPRLTPAQLARLLRWAAGVNGDRSPDRVYDITHDELDEVVSAARARVIRGRAGCPPGLKAAAAWPTTSPAGAGYQPPAWLADVFGGEP